MKRFLYILLIILLAGVCPWLYPGASQAQTTIKITELTEDTTPTPDDLIITVTDPAGTPANRKVTLGNLGKGLSGVDAAKMADGSVSNTEFQYLDGLTGDIQDQLDGKSASTHNHDATYSLLGHNHSGVYQPYDLDLETIAGLACGNGQIMKRSAGGAWECAADSTGGSPSFDTIVSGENTAATMTLGAGGVLTFTSTGIVNASRFQGVTSVDATEFGYLDGLTGSIQTQLDGKAPSIHLHDSEYISVITTPTAGNFPTTTAGGELQNSSYGPASFSTVGHTHTSSNVTDFNEASQDSVGGILTDTTTINFTYNDAGNQITADVITDTSVQKLDVRKNTGGTNVGSRRRLNFIEGSNVVITVSDDGTDNEIDINIAAPGTSGYTTIQEEGTPLTQRTTFNFVGSGFTAADDAGNTRTNVTLDADLNALADLATTGILARTGAATYSPRTMTGDTEIVVSNGDGVSGNPTFSIGAGITRDSELSAYVLKSLYDAQSILQATADDTPAALVIAEQKVVGRATGGNIAALDIDSDLSSVSGNDDTLPSAKATKTALDGKSNTGHAHAASDVTSGVFDNARINWAAPGAIGGTTPGAGTFTTMGAGAGGFSVDADGDIVGKSLTITKQSGVAGDIGLFEANSTDTDAAGWKGPASLTYSYRGQFPNIRATSGNMVHAWTNSGETGTGTPSDPFVQPVSFVDLDDYALASHNHDGVYQPDDVDLDSLAAGITGVVKGLGNGNGYEAATYADFGKINNISSFGTPTTDNPYSLSAANAYNSSLWYGATGEIDLPAAVAGMSIIIYNTGAFTITIDPNSTDVIVRDGTAQSGGVSITLSSGAGNYVTLICDVANHWVTLGYKGTLAQGS